jgi:pimeloyl-[acyl-carrier protein] methyl ester esterase
MACLRRATRICMSAPEKTAIVLLPGMDGTGEFLRPLAEQLSRHRQVLLVDYPADRCLGYDQLTSYVRDRAPGDRFVVLGESFSGPIAIEIAAIDARVAGLVLASSFARHPLPTQFAAFAGLLDLRWVPTGVLVAALMGSAATPELRVRLREVLARLPREVMRARAQEVLRVDKRGRLAEIKCPMLCLHGRSDRLVSKRHADDIVAVQPACQALWMDASHMLLATHTDAAANLIEDFCEQVDRRGAIVSA